MKYEEDLTSRENLLLESEPSEGVGGKEAKKLRERFFKCYVIAFAIFVWTGYTLLVAYTRQMTPKSELYSSSTVVFFSECIKLVISVFFVYRECEFSLKKGNQLLKNEYFSKPTEFAKMSVPSLAYALQNNLDFIALSNLEASVYQVITQLKIPSAAVFMMIFLGRRFSIRRWLSIFLLCAGVALVQRISWTLRRSMTTTNRSSQISWQVFSLFWPPALLLVLLAFILRKC